MPLYLSWLVNLAVWAVLPGYVLYVDKHKGSKWNSVALAICAFSVKVWVQESLIGPYSCNIRFLRPAYILLFWREHLSGSNVLNSRCEGCGPSVYAPMCLSHDIGVRDDIKCIWYVVSFAFRVINVYIKMVTYCTYSL